MDKTVFQTIRKDIAYGRGYVYSIQYHIVWCTMAVSDRSLSQVEEYIKSQKQK